MQLITDSKFYLFATILSNGISLLLLPFYTQYLSPSDFGIIALFVTFGQVSTGLISLGIHKATYKYFFDYEWTVFIFDLFIITSAKTNGTKLSK